MRIITGGLALGLLLVQACATPVDTASGGVGTEVGQPAYTAKSGLSTSERFRLVLSLLEDGEAGSAKTELTLYLKSQPGSEIGQDLLRQIVDSPSDYFPMEYREVKLAPGQTLSSLSQQYLGSLYQFHALAKYNGILEPRKLTAGQTIKIPLTDTAREVFLAGSPEAITEVEVPVEPVEPVNTTPPEPEVASSVPSSESADQLHRAALDAYRAQNLDKAISLWEEVLKMDPNYENAKLYLSQAYELKEKLRKLN